MIKPMTPPLSHDVLDQASEWFARLNSNRVSVQDQIEFSRWLAENPDHEAAYHQIETLWEQLAIVAKLPISHQTNTLTVTRKIKQKYLNPNLFTYKQTWSYASALCAIFIAVTFLIMQYGNRGEIYFTSPGEQKQITLEDGSILFLNTHSKVAIKYSQELRQVYLEYGEVLFDVAPDSNRPFIVISGSVTANAVGTVFNVYRRCTDNNDTIITVIEGKVKVIDQNNTPGKQDNTAKLLHASEQTHYNRSGIGTTLSVDARLVTSWTEQKLIYDGVPLTEVLEDLNRYSTQTIRIADESLRHIPVSAVFRVQDQDTLLKSLEHAFGLKAIEISDHIILLDKARFYE